MRCDVLTAKYYLAGGSARWMFDVSSSQLLSVCVVKPPALGTISVTSFGYHLCVGEGSHFLSRMNGKAVIVSQYIIYW